MNAAGAWVEDEDLDAVDVSAAIVLEEDESSAGGQESEPQLVYANVAEFVEDHLSQLYRRQVGAGTGLLRWSARWWENAEAISRLDTLWRAWEHLRLDGALGMSVWWRDHADYHMSILLSPDGPFRGSTDENNRGDPLPCEAPPPGLFPTADPA